MQIFGFAFISIYSYIPRRIPRGIVTVTAITVRVAE